MVPCFEIFSFGRFAKLKALRLLRIYINPGKPGSSATLPQLREFTLTVHSNVYSRDMTDKAKADMGYGFLARHPQLESLVVLSFSGDFWQPLSLERNHCPDIRVLCIGPQPELTETFSSLAGQLQKLSRYIGRWSLPLLEHMSMLPKSVLHVTDYLPISFVRSLPISI
ncbi:hypothetical protein M422DRAFT_34661, partial [Sphaerobolus stellatus SS14]